MTCDLSNPINTVGRPRSVSLSKEEMILLGEEMITWININYDKVFHLSQWYTVEKMYTYNQWKAFIQLPEFLPYYEKALKLIGPKYLNGTVKDGVAQRWQRHYYGDLRELEDEDAKFNAKLAAKDDNSVSPNEELTETKHELMLTKAELAGYKEANANKSQAG